MITNFFINRPVVATLLIAIIAFSILTGIGFYQDGSIFDYFNNNLPIFVLSSVIFMTPIFVHATSNTLKIDLIDPDLIKKVKHGYGDFDSITDKPFVMILGRLYLEMADQRGHATKNLALGVGFTIIAVVLSVFLIVTAQSESVQKMELSVYLTTFLIPKVAVILFIEGIGLFFLKWYGKNIQEISAISKQMLEIEMKALTLYVDKSDANNKEILLNNLCKSDSNSNLQNSNEEDKELMLLLSKLMERINLRFTKKL